MKKIIVVVGVLFGLWYGYTAVAQTVNSTKVVNYAFYMDVQLPPMTTSTVVAIPLGTVTPEQESHFVVWDNVAQTFVESYPDWTPTNAEPMPQFSVFSPQLEHPEFLVDDSASTTVTIPPSLASSTELVFTAPVSTTVFMVSALAAPYSQLPVTMDVAVEQNGVRRTVVNNESNYGVAKFNPENSKIWIVTLHFAYPTNVIPAQIEDIRMYTENNQNAGANNVKERFFAQLGHSYKLYSNPTISGDGDFTMSPVNLYHATTSLLAAVGEKHEPQKPAINNVQNTLETAPAQNTYRSQESPAVLKNKDVPGWLVWVGIGSAGALMVVMIFLVQHYKKSSQ